MPIIKKKKLGLPEREDRSEEIMSEITEENFQNSMSCFQTENTHTKWKQVYTLANLCETSEP